MYCKVDDDITRPRQHVAPGISERKRRRVGERGHIEVAVRVSLIGRKAYPLPCHDVWPIGSSGIREVGREVHGIERCAILQRYRASRLPVREDGPQHLW